MTANTCNVQLQALALTWIPVTPQPAVCVQMCGVKRAAEAPPEMPEHHLLDLCSCEAACSAATACCTAEEPAASTTAAAAAAPSAWSAAASRDACQAGAAAAA